MDLQTFDTGTGFLKAGFLGFPKSGKTFTAALLAAQTRAHFGLEAPIAFLDTEAGGIYVNQMVRDLTGKSIIGIRSRVFADLMELAAICEEGEASVLVVDSITHVWREVCESYLREVNAARRSQGKSARSRLEFQDWGKIKSKWGEWADFYLNSELHICICGRAGYEWNFETTENADGSERKELRKTGVKMKVESEFGFEPSLLVYMERVSDYDEATGMQKYVHRGHVIGDRFQVLDGKICDNPTAEFFRPHLDMLTPGASNTVDTSPRTPMGVDEAGDAEWQRELRARKIICENIQGLLTSAWPGQTKPEKKAKTDALEQYFGTRSWTEVSERMSREELLNRYHSLKTALESQEKPE